MAIAANPDTAIHAARSCKGVSFIRRGEELAKLGGLSVIKLEHSLVSIEPGAAEEIQETFKIWGVRTFADLARLPLAGVAERLGQPGVQLQKLAQGKTDRRLNLVRPPRGFEQSLELEHAVSELEPLSFILSRLLNYLCANLEQYALATNEVRLQLVLEPQATAAGSNRNHRDKIQSSAEVDETAELHERTITLPVPMRNPRTLLRLLLFDIEAHPPAAAIRIPSTNGHCTPASPPAGG